MHIHEGIVISIFGKFEGQDPHKCGGFAPHHTIYGYNERDVVADFIKAKIQVIIYIFFLVKCH